MLWFTAITAIYIYKQPQQFVIIYFRNFVSNFFEPILVKGLSHIQPYLQNYFSDFKHLGLFENQKDRPKS